MLSNIKLRRYLSLNAKELVGEKNHVIGDGSVGGKAKGLIFAKEVLNNMQEIPPWPVYIPPSRFITTEVFDEFMEDNELEEVVEEGDWEKIKKAFAEASFPESIIEDLKKWVCEMDYPLAVRSSSLLEDSIRYSFAGKYLTLFVSNRGGLDDRIRELLCAIKKVYASTYGPVALEYRKKHSLEGESMGIIVQQLIGKRRGSEFYPEIAGVGFSRNYRRWTERIRVEDGVVRVVFGLGTRCTGRNYARIFSLTNLNLRPEGNDPTDIMRYSQEIFDLLDLEDGGFKSFNINDRKDLIRYHPNFERLAGIYTYAEDMVIPYTSHKEGKIIFTFDGLPRSHPSFFRLMGFLFKLFEKEMGIPVDVEFASEPLESFFALVQLRPLSSYESHRPVMIPKNIPEDKLILRGNRMLTNGILKKTRYMVYVDPWAYVESFDPHKVAREIGKINRVLEGERFILIGPGRWGTSNPRQGVPVEYSEISNCGMIVEIGVVEKGFTPELSYGTHFFADLELDGILYLPIFIGMEGNVFNRDWFNSHPYKRGEHPSIRIYEGTFSAYLDGHKIVGVLVDES